MSVTPQQVVSALKSSDSPITLNQLSGCSARVLTHNYGEDVTKLPLTSVKFAFCSGPEWLHHTLSSRESQRQWLLNLGFPKDWLKKKINEQNKQFTLIVFRPKAKQGFTPTWKNIFEIALPSAFPGQKFELLRKRVLNHRALLESTSYEAIEEKAIELGLKNFRANKEGHGELTAEEYMNAEDTLVNCRRFLRKEFFLNDLFTGNGETLKEDGTKGFPEVLVWNSPVAALNELAILKLNNKVILGEKNNRYFHVTLSLLILSYIILPF